MAIDILDTKKHPGFLLWISRKIQKLSDTLQNNVQGLRANPSVNICQLTRKTWRPVTVGWCRSNSAELPRCHSNMARLLPSVAGVVATKKTAANMEFLQHSK
jgi:hypothetical protein